MLLSIMAAALLLTGGSFANQLSASELHATTQALLRRGLESQAITELKEQIATGQDAGQTAAAWLELARIYESHENGGSEAAAALVHALELLPKDAPQRDALHYRLARALESTGDTVRAANEYQVILLEFPQSAYYERASKGITRCFESNQPRIAATVGGHMITVEALDRVIQRLDGVAQSEIERRPERRMEVLKQMTEEKLLADYARSSGLQLEGDIREELNHNIDRFLAQYVLQRRVTEKVEITPEEVRHYYDTHRATDYYSEPRVRGFSFVVDSEKEAQEVYREIKDGGFADVKERLGKSSESRGGGDSGLRRLSDFPESQAEALRNAHLHEVLPPRKSSQGWEVFYIQVYHPGTYTEFDAVQAQLRKTLKNRAQRELYTALVDSLKSEIPVTIQATN